MSIKQFLEKLNTSPNAIEFSEVMDLISEHYHYTPTQFSNGKDDDQVINTAGTNEGSCKLFAFAQDQQLSQQQTLYCFGTYYRDDVLGKPDGTDHANIRNFIKYGWQGITFEQTALTHK